jgi:hypothetical protein
MSDEDKARAKRVQRLLHADEDRRVVKVLVWGVAAMMLIFALSNLWVDATRPWTELRQEVSQAIQKAATDLQKSWNSRHSDQ